MIKHSSLCCLFNISILCPNELSVKEPDAGKEVKVAVGGILTVELDSNPSTGFKWELVDITDASVIEKMSDKFEAAMIKQKEGSPPIVGCSWEGVMDI